MKQYFTPMLLTNLNGSIDIADSQQGAWGGGSTDYSDFEAWWNSEDVINNRDLIYELYPTFNVSDPSTWPQGFVANDPTTYDVLFGG